MLPPLIKLWHNICVQSQGLSCNASKTFLKKDDFKVLFTFRAFFLLADRHELQIKHQLTLTIWHHMELSIDVLAVDLKCLKGILQTISIGQ